MAVTPCFHPLVRTRRRARRSTADRPTRSSRTRCSFVCFNPHRRPSCPFRYPRVRKHTRRRSSTSRAAWVKTPPTPTVTARWPSSPVSPAKTGRISLNSCSPKVRTFVTTGCLVANVVDLDWISRSHPHPEKSSRIRVRRRAVRDVSSWNGRAIDGGFYPRRSCVVSALKTRGRRRRGGLIDKISGKRVLDSF